MRKTLIRAPNLGINHRCVLPAYRFVFGLKKKGFAVAGNDLGYVFGRLTEQ